MKKAAALVLALTMLLSMSLCAYGESPGENVFLIENPELVEVGDGLYTLDFKFTCLYPEKSGEDYPELFDINYVLLDAEDTVIQKCKIQIGSIFYGDKYKAAATNSFKNRDNYFRLEDVSSVKFQSVGAWRGECETVRFAEPVVFELAELMSEAPAVSDFGSTGGYADYGMGDAGYYGADYYNSILDNYLADLEGAYPGLDLSGITGMGGLPGSAAPDTAAMNDALEIEAVKVERDISYSVKIKNNYQAQSGRQPNYIMLQCQLLDSSGAILETAYFIYEDLEYGQSGWASMNIGTPVTELGALKFTSYDFQYNTHNPTAPGTLYGFEMLGGGVFTEPVTVPVEEIEIDGVAGALRSDEAAGAQSQYFTLDALCVDDSYRDEDNSPLRRVYLFYTFKAGDSNVKISPKYTYLTINDKNEYESTLDYEARKFIKNYYHSNYLEEVYLGSELKVMASFKIPEADLAPGRSITVKDTDIPDCDRILLNTDDLQHFDGVEEIAAAIDPEGYAEMLEKRAEADAETAGKVKNIITNRRYWCYVNGLEYTFEFYPGNKWAMFTSINDVEGTYSVRNGYIFCTNSETGHVIEIPWNWEGDLVNLDTDDAMDVQ